MAASSSPSASAPVVGEWHMLTLGRVSRQWCPGDLGHKILRHMFEMRLHSGGIDGRIVSQIREIQRIGSEMGLDKEPESAHIRSAAAFRAYF